MKAFVALMLVAAVSGQMTFGNDRTLYDILRNRQLYPTGMYHRGVSGLKTDVTGVSGDWTTGYLPSTQQFNIPSDVTVYTLRQLYTLPVFQEYLTLPLFKQYLTVPAFQRYLTSVYFQQYFTQTLFKQFFVDPVLFYKYIYPVVLQFNTGVTGVDTTLVVPEIYSHLVPEIYRNVYNKEVIPTVYNGVVPTTGVNYEDVINKIVEGKVYGNGYVDELLRKIILGQVYGNGIYGTGVFGTGLNKDLIRRILYPQVYGTGVYGNGIYGTGIYGNGVYGKDLFGTGVYGQDLLRKILLGQVYGNGVYGNGVWGNTLYNGLLNNGKMMYTTGNTFGGLEGLTGIHKVAPVVLENIVKDLFNGKITFDDLKGNTEMLGENKIVDPITGDIKVVTEKIVKPVDTVVDEQLNKEMFLNKMLKKNVFHKL